MLSGLTMSSFCRSSPRGAAALRKVEATRIPPGRSTLLISATCKVHTQHVCQHSEHGMPYTGPPCHAFKVKKKELCVFVLCCWTLEAFVMWGKHGNGSHSSSGIWPTVDGSSSMYCSQRSSLERKATDVCSQEHVLPARWDYHIKQGRPSYQYGQTRGCPARLSTSFCSGKPGTSTMSGGAYLGSSAVF
jgi:hypothetical protein